MDWDFLSDPWLGRCAPAPATPRSATMHPWCAPPAVEPALAGPLLWATGEAGTRRLGAQEAEQRLCALERTRLVRGTLDMNLWAHLHPAEHSRSPAKRASTTACEAGAPTRFVWCNALLCGPSMMRFITTRAGLVRPAMPVDPTEMPRAALRTTLVSVLDGR